MNFFLYLRDSDFEVYPIVVLTPHKTYALFLTIKDLGWFFCYCY